MSNASRTPGRKKRLTPAQARMQSAVARLQNYMNTYTKQYGYLDYSDETLIHDVLYGLGIALDPHYAYADGYAMFRKRLRLMLNKSTERAALAAKGEK